MNFVKELVNRVTGIISHCYNIVISWMYGPGNKEESDSVVEFNNDELDQWRAITEDYDKIENIEYNPKEYIMKLNKSLIRVNIIKNNVYITIPDQRDEIEPMQSINITEDDHIIYIKNENSWAAMSYIKIGNHKFWVTCSHVMSMLSLDDIRGFKPINEHLCAKGKDIAPKQFKWIISIDKDVHWTTKEIITDKPVYIITKVTKTIMAHVLTKGRPMLTTIGIIVGIKYDQPMVLSGTIMTVDKKPFIVTYLHKNKLGISFIIAVAPMGHEYKIIVQE